MKFAPGRGNMKLLVQYNDGVDIWDAKEVRQLLSERMISSTSRRHQKR